jgi:hypothetical protein
LFKTRFLKFGLIALAALIGGVLGYTFASFQNPNPQLVGRFNKDEAATAVALQFASPQNRENFKKHLLRRRVQRFYGGTFSCIKFYPDWLAYGYEHVACDFGNDQIEVSSF